MGTSGNPRVVVITGPTASGKTAISIEMAKRFNGEIISADSRQVYRGLDIGTAKIKPEEMQGIPHHLISIRNPQFSSPCQGGNFAAGEVGGLNEEQYTVVDFKRDAEKLISEITARNKLPIIVGGTLLYIKALTENYQILKSKPDFKLREELENLTTYDLRLRLQKLDPTALEQIDINNPRRLIRAIEQITATGKPLSEIRKKGESKYNTLMIALDVPREELYKRIDERIDDRMKAGMLEEVEGLLKRGVSETWLHGLGLEYRFLTEYLIGQRTPRESEQALVRFQEMTQRLKYASHQYARRQLTWLRREKEAVWCPPDAEYIENKITVWRSAP